MDLKETQMGQHKYRDSERDILKFQTCNKGSVPQGIDGILAWAMEILLERREDATAQVMVLSFLRPVRSFQGGNFRDHNWTAAGDWASRRIWALCSHLFHHFQEEILEER